MFGCLRAQQQQQQQLTVCVLFSISPSAPFRAVAGWVFQATWDLLTDRYSVRNNLVLQFKRDTIDQSPQLAETLFNRFGRDGELEFSRRVFFFVADGHG